MSMVNVVSKYLKGEVIESTQTFMGGDNPIKKQENTDIIARDEKTLNL